MLFNPITGEIVTEDIEVDNPLEFISLPEYLKQDVLHVYEGVKRIILSEKSLLRKRLMEGTHRANVRKPRRKS